MTPLLRCSAFILLLVAFAGTTTAQEKKPLAVEDLYKLDAPRDAVLSPDAKSLVYARQWIDPKTKTERFSLWRVEDDPKNAKPMEKGEPDARTPVFSPDGKWIAFLSTRKRPGGWGQTPATPAYSDPATDIWLIPAKGGTAIPLAGENKPYGRAFNDGFYGRLAFSPDGKKLAFVADDGKTRIPTDIKVVRQDQGEGYTGWGAAQIWVAHLDPNPKEFAATKIDRLTNDNVWYGDPNWHPNGKTLAVHANRTNDRESARYSINKNFDIWLIDVETKKLTQVTTGPGPEVSPRFSPDGTKIACLSCPRKGTHRDEFNLAIIDLSGEKPEVRVPFNHHDAKKDSKGYPRPLFPLPVDCWESDCKHLICTAEAGADNQMMRIDTSTGRGEAPLLYILGSPKKEPKQQELPERLAVRTNLTPKGNTFLNERLVAEQKVISWKSDEFTIEGILTLPPEVVAKPPYKLFVHPHGGPHGRQTPGFDFTVQLFAAHGYAVLQPNFRGSTGYGQKFIDADRGDFGGGDMRDIMRGVDKLIEDKVADKDRLFVYGISYGGYMTSWLVGQTDRFRAAVAQNAVTDLSMMWHLSDLQSWTEWEFGGKPWEQPEKYRKHSPLTYADKVKTPTLILHARDDRRCPLPMGQAFHKALNARGVPTGLVIYPDEGHGIKQPQHREDVLRRVLAWFEKYDKK